LLDVALSYPISCSNHQIKSLVFDFQFRLDLGLHLRLAVQSPLARASHKCECALSIQSLGQMVFVVKEVQHNMTQELLTTPEPFTLRHTVSR
jgi:hypothetical protein